LNGTDHAASNWQEGPTATLSAASFAALTALVQGALLVGIRQTAGELSQRIRADLCGWLAWLRSAAPSHEPNHCPDLSATPFARWVAAQPSGTTPPTQPDAPSQSIQRPAQAENEADLLSQLEKLVGTHWHREKRQRSGENAVTARTLLPDLDPEGLPRDHVAPVEAQQRLLLLQALLKELRTSNQQLSQRLGTRE
jgi:hypothetical protein